MDVLHFQKEEANGIGVEEEPEEGTGLWSETVDGLLVAQSHVDQRRQEILRLSKKPDIYTLLANSIGNRMPINTTKCNNLYSNSDVCSHSAGCVGTR